MTQLYEYYSCKASPQRWGASPQCWGTTLQCWGATLQCWGASPRDVLM